MGVWIFGVTIRRKWFVSGGFWAAGDFLFLGGRGEGGWSDRSDWGTGRTGRTGRTRSDGRGAAGSGEGGVDFLFCFVAVFEGFVCSFEGGIRFCES